MRVIALRATAKFCPYDNKILINVIRIFPFGSFVDKSESLYIYWILKLYKYL
jgi:hypothetical protein